MTRQHHLPVPEGRSREIALEAGGALVGKKVRIEINVQAAAPSRL